MRGSNCVLSTPLSLIGRGFAALNDFDHAPGRQVAAAPPLIGISSYLEQAQTGVWDVRAAFLPKVYIDGVTEAGGVAVLLPPQPSSPSIARAVLSRLDGLIISGGADVNPALYGQQPHERTGLPRDDRDAWEDALLSEAVASGVPFLGICRGVQMLNVALGGTLHQHVPDVVGSDDYQPAPGQFGRKDVAVEPDSQIGRLLRQGEEPLSVHVYHHQAIDEVAAGLTVTARSEDGVIEAVEIEGDGFGIGVQWHPEENVEDRRLFAGLVEAAREHARQREQGSGR
ncbi:gamma-glutamyl-gamma-aminobutyrate hydrolase [Salinibacterium hongtaonis]|uniref:Gamma-glutamyl-gamma-aminobutyrate hydrolase n=1 Tax=Homoserinimonas hongtaonis TaxID=2079791 RepID=A0A2U1SZ65_9MICO|nr:gamma-glutamyl-gamma-aminobutyrate hydrolase [Salinibacterium hongtaonis]